MEARQNFEILNRDPGVGCHRHGLQQERILHVIQKFVKRLASGSHPLRPFSFYPGTRVRR